MSFCVGVRMGGRCHFIFIILFCVYYLIPSAMSELFYNLTPTHSYLASACIVLMVCTFVGTQLMFLVYLTMLMLMHDV